MQAVFFLSFQFVFVMVIFRIFCFLIVKLFISQKQTKELQYPF